jgi:prepilin-type N-terminal cleavage/methylation domain-containing protein
LNLKIKIQNTHFKSHSSNEYGFTLIELLIVIAIIGLLASIIFASLSNARLQAFNKKTLQDKSTLIQALKLYIGDIGGNQIANMFPNTNCIGTAGDTCLGGLISANPTLDAALRPYIQNYPRPRGRSTWSRGNIPLVVDTTARTIGIVWPIEGTNISSCPVGVYGSYLFAVPGDFNYTYCLEYFEKY